MQFILFAIKRWILFQFKIIYSYKKMPILNNIDFQIKDKKHSAAIHKSAILRIHILFTNKVIDFYECFIKLHVLLIEIALTL